jgi:AraC family transcriptional regulator of adaptative response/methylated-DNA-[protein]-cysteine methyltransferase
VKLVVKHIESPVRNLDLKLDIRGTEFQKKVYKAIIALPFGETTTYAAIARRIGSPRAMRAVGSACSNCIISFAIPCYRVLRSDGVFYIRNDKGESRQKILLEREARAGKRKKAA